MGNKFAALALLAAAGTVVGCTPSEPGMKGAAGAGGGTAGVSAAAGTSGGGSAGTNGAAGTTAAAGTNGAAGTTTMGGAGTMGPAGTTGSAGSGTDAGAGTGGSGSAGTGAAGAGAAGSGTAGAGPSFLPAGYTGTPFTALKLPGRINACDYDRGGAGVAWCHSPGNCAGGTVTGDYPAGAPVYRAPMPATAKLCTGAACDDNVGVCRMNPSKPDKVDATTPAPPADTYLCYTQAGTWTKYTVVVTQAGTYAVGGFMAVPQGGAANLSFGATITTGNLTLAVTNPSMCGGGEYYHCWAQRENLATVTFPQAGTYLMTLTQVGRFNASSFSFTKM
jgi:hypothetical protein